MGATVGTEAEVEGEPQVGPRTRTRADRDRRGGQSIIRTIKQLPNYGKLVLGLLTDPRVSTLDKALLGAAVAYVVSPINLIPEFIPVLGELDDLFVLVLAIQHLVAGTDPEVLLDHWHGDPEELENLNIRRALLTAALFFPRSLRRRLRLIGRDA
jgi:uncharacterized membrane protein YkvA (DUF1232 family)